jgi:hypothetical protein
MRFNQLVELTSALSEADKDTKYVLSPPRITFHLHLFFFFF